ncbi:putative spermidine/putrescine transport system permease protein [Paracoccus isoporae]|uniref:Putative spermidine/putrescine transport system permease protein n=1 Tax=Paracoccus isoporae TaxID=591205 RepID=A0A1G6SSU8_9RHOB|nr:ABC transporter permease [Paracoccus isoporae]SDD19205.1 putative spermidine/putrescine transport system permease protein [Paracoccus isoporae]
MALPSYASPLERIWHRSYLVICALIFIFLIAPILVIIPLSFNAARFFTFTREMLSFDPAGYSMQWYDTLATFGMASPDAPRDANWFADMWANAKWVNAAKNSVLIGILSTALATVLGTLAALGLSRPEMPFRRLIMATLISPMIVPLIITATGLFFFYSSACLPEGSWLQQAFSPILSNRGCLANTHLGVILAHATLGVPFVIITVTATLIGFDQSLNRAAASLGASPRTTFFRITMPLILPGVISGALFAFVTSFDEVVVVLFIAGPDQQTIPRQMWIGIREQLSPAILAVATLLVVFSIALLATVEILRRRSERIRGITPS